MNALISGFIATFFIASSTMSLAVDRSGERIWMETCGYCHETGIGPELRGRHLSFAMIQLWTRHGLRQMPAFSDSAISATELQVLAEWIQHQSAPTNPGDSHATP